MKKLKILLFTAAVLFAVIISISEVTSQSNLNMKDRFFLGPMNFFFDNRLRTSDHMGWYNELSYNMMQNYCAHLDDTASDWQSGTQRDGGFFEDIGNYGSFIDGVMRQWDSLKNINSLIFEREKILRPAFGQRFTFQAEQPGTWHTKFPGYGYDSSETGQYYTENWMSETVTGSKCISGVDTAGYIVKSLYENCGQTNDTRIIPDNQNSSGWERLYSDIKQRKYNMRWFVKPRMRIDSVYAKTHPDDSVVVVYTKRFDGKVIDSISITCKNFLILDEFDNKFYNGRYLERYYNFALNPADTANSLSVSSDSLAMGRDSLPYDSSKVDYQVKWLGKVDVWLDYVRVDDSWAHYLFTDTWENEPQNPANMWKFHRKIKEEVDAFKNTPGLAYFWVDEVQFANLECLGEVNRLVREYSDNQLSVLFITEPGIFQGWSGLRNQDNVWNAANWDTCINTAVRTGALKDIMVTEWFPIYYKTKYPSALSIINQIDS